MTDNKLLRLKATIADNCACNIRDIPDDYFYEKPYYDKAKQICATCPVVDKCRQYAHIIERGQPLKMIFGVYAGLTPRERFWRRYEMIPPANRRDNLYSAMCYWLAGLREAGMGQGDVADMLGVTVEQVNSWETEVSGTVDMPVAYEAKHVSEAFNKATYVDVVRDGQLFIVVNDTPVFAFDDTVSVEQAVAVAHDSRVDNLARIVYALERAYAQMCMNPDVYSVKERYLKFLATRVTIVLGAENGN